jgi:hypothetical protein
MLRLLAFAGLAASFAAGAADIQKCADGDGGVVYQDSPCPRGSRIGTIPRVTARADPAALRKLERDRARLEQQADAHIAAQRQQEAALTVRPQPSLASGEGYEQSAAPANIYTGPAYSVDPVTGALIVPEAAATAQGVQPSSTAQPMSPVTQPPSSVPSSPSAAGPSAAPVAQSPRGVPAIPAISARPAGGAASPSR